MSTKRGMHRAVGIVGALAAVVLSTLLAGCSGSDDGTASGPVSGPTDQAKSKAVLAQSRTELHTLIDSLAPSANASAKGPFALCAGGRSGIPPVACTGFDGQAPCAEASEIGSQRWGYNVNLHVATPTNPDATNAGNAVLAVLQSSQWKATRLPNSANVLDVQAVKNGMTLRVLAEDLPGVLNIEGYGPCVSPAGVALKG